MKYHVKDEDGNKFEVEEIETETPATEPVQPTEPIANDVETLSDDDIKALKSLASIADKLIALVSVEAKEHAATEEPVTDEDECGIDKNDDDEVIDTCSKMSDSKKSVGAIEKQTSIEDSIDANSIAIEDAWTKRFGGNK